MKKQLKKKMKRSDNAIFYFTTELHHRLTPALVVKGSTPDGRPTHCTSGCIRDCF